VSKEEEEQQPQQEQQDAEIFQGTKLVRRIL
jgi:hypothetical protein